MPTTCPYVNQNGVRCGQPAGHGPGHGNGLRTRPRDVWTLPVWGETENTPADVGERAARADTDPEPPPFCLRARDPFAPQLIALWLVHLRRNYLGRPADAPPNWAKLHDAESKLMLIQDWQRRNPDKVKVPD